MAIIKFSEPKNTKIIILARCQRTKKLAFKRCRLEHATVLVAKVKEAKIFLAFSLFFIIIIVFLCIRLLHTAEWTQLTIDGATLDIAPFSSFFWDNHKNKISSSQQKSLSSFNLLYTYINLFRSYKFKNLSKNLFFIYKSNTNK